MKEVGDKGFSRWRLIAVLGVVFVLSGLGGLFFDGRFMDDAYISFRYAYFFGEGLPFYWNYADPPVEGFSNLLWTLILVPVAHFPGVIETVVHWFAVLLVAATGSILVLWGTLRAGLRGAIVGLGLFALVLASPSFWHGALNGIESPMYLLGLTLATLVVLDDRFVMRPTIPALALAFVVLVRFDGVIFASMLGTVYFLRVSAQTGRSWSATRPFQVALGLFVALSAFRLLYLGSLIPLSVNAKTTNWLTLARVEGLRGFWSYLSIVLRSGGTYVVEFLSNPGIWIVVGLFSVAIAMLTESFLAKLVLVMIPSGAMAIVILNWGDWMPGFRLLIPFLGVMVAVALGPLSDVSRGVMPQTARAVATGILAAVTLGALSGVIVPGGIAGMATPQFRRSYEAEAKAFGPYWDGILQPVEVYTAARGGALPYSAPTLRNFGFHGLFDECIGRSGYKTQGSTGKRNWDCVFEKQPAVLDANNIPFAVSVAEAAEARGYELSVALCGTSIRLTGGRWVFFVANWKIDAATKVDSDLVVVPLATWLEDPEAFSSGASCDMNPQVGFSE